MIYRDTRDSSCAVDFRTAVLSGMNAKTGGLYVPETIPRLPKELLGKSVAPSFRDVALEAVKRGKFKCERPECKSKYMTVRYNDCIFPDMV